MRISELLEAQDNIADFFHSQQSKELKKQKKEAQKKVSYYVKIHIFPDVKNTVGVYWLTPDQLHYSYNDAARVGVAKPINAENAIREVSSLVGDLSNLLHGDPLERKRVEIQLPSNLQKVAPEFYNKMAEWQSRITANPKSLTSFKIVEPAAVNILAKQTPATGSSNAPTIIKPTRDQVEQMFKRVFTSDASLSQLLRANRTTAVEKNINDIIVDNWGEDFDIISDEIRDYLSSI